MPIFKVLLSLCMIVVLMVCGETVYAARSIVITLDKDSIKGEDEVHVTASLSGFLSDETIKIKGVFFAESSSNYFGYTKNGESWVKCGDATVNQMEVNVSNWNNELILRCDYSDSGFIGEGEYRVKVGYYIKSSSGSYGSVSWSNALPIIINMPDPTPTLTPTNTLIPTPTRTPTPSVTPTFVAPTNTPKMEDADVLSTPFVPTPVSTLFPKVSVSISSPTRTDTVNVLGTMHSSPAAILQHQAVASDSAKETMRKASTAFAFIGMGLAVLSIAKSIEAWQRTKE